MLLIRLTLAAVALLLLPATALADLRSPVLGEASTLSTAPESRTYQPSIATDGNTTFVAFSEHHGGVSVRRISATGTEIGPVQEIQMRGTVSTDLPQIAVSGEHVYVAWIQTSGSEVHAVVATSRDGGRTFGTPVAAGRPTGHSAWDIELAADGDNVFVAWVDDRDRVWTAGSRDGGRTFPCQATVTLPGDEVDGGGDYALAVDGDRVIWTWAGDDGDVYARRSPDAGRTLELPFRVYDTPAFDLAGSPTIAADDGVVAIAYSEEFRMPRADRSGIDFGWEPIVFSSRDGGRSWAETFLGNSANRCVGDYCAAPYGLAVSDGDVYVGWRGQGRMWLGHSTDGGLGFVESELGPYAYSWHTQQMPHVAAHGDTFVATWHTAPDPGSFDMGPIAAFSSDRGQTFALRTVDDRAGQDLLPVAAAWGPDPQGAGFAWWSLDHSLLSGDTHVRFAPLSAAEPDVSVVDVRPVQAAGDAARLAAGRPTTIRAMLRSQAAQRVRVPLEIELAYDVDGQRVERQVVQDVVLRPGLNPVQLLADEPVKVGSGRITATVKVDPSVPDNDPSNNEGEGSRAVVQTRPLKILFVPVSADDELPPACNDVRAVAEGTAEYLKATWPLDPAKVSVVTDCSTRLVHPAGLTEVGLMMNGGLMSKVDRQKFAGDRIDKVVGVVPQGWFSRQLIAGFATAVGIAPIGSTLDAAIVERQNSGGWVVAHELAHNLGWTEEEGEHGNHLDSEPAPGYWVTERRDIPATTLDFMQFSTAGAPVTETTGRWMSKKSWDFLTTTLSTGELGAAARGLAASRTLSLNGSVSPAGAVTVSDLWELDGEPDHGDGEGPLTFEQLDAGGAVLQTRRFGASNDLGPIGNDRATGDEHIETDTAGFSLRVPALDAARRLRIRRGDEVLLERARSASAPAVTIETPARVEVGADLKLQWTASDADGDALTHFVSISLDGGATWRSLGDQLSGGALTVKALVQLAGTDVRVRVTTTDGWNTATSESGSFAIGGELSDGLVVADDWFGAVWTVALDGSGAKKISDEDARRARWSPDGRKLAWDNSGIFTADADGTGLRKLTPPGQWFQPVWTPDGDGLLVDKWRLGSHDYNVEIDAETGAETDFALKHAKLCGYTRDGSGLLASGNGQWRFALYRPDGTGPQEFGGEVIGYDCMSLSPDGRHGVVARIGDQSIIDVVVYDLQTKTMRNLTNGQFGAYNAHPTWSPTGEWIVWGSNRDRGGRPGFGSTDLWKIRPDGTGAMKILDGAPDSRNFEQPDVQPRRGVAPDPEPTREELRPAADAGGVYEIGEGTQLALDASGSKPGADEVAIDTYEWDLDGDGVYTDAAGATPKASFPDEGTYSVGVLVTDAQGRSSTAAAEVRVTNTAPVIRDARVGDGEPANFSARIADPGLTDVQSAKLYWDGSATGENVPVIPSGDGYMVMANRPGKVATVRVVVSDGDGGTAEATSERVLVPANGAPGADDAGASVVAGETVDIDLPARDPEGEKLSYEIVSEPAHGSLAKRAPGAAPEAPDVTYLADGEYTGADTFTYRVSDGAGQSRVATVTVTVKPRPDAVSDPEPKPRPAEPELPEAPRAERAGTKPVDQRKVDAATEELRAAPTVAAYVTLPSTRKCVSRRNFTIRVKKTDARKITVHVNGKRVKVARGKATVDLRGLPKGRFTVKIAVTLKDGKVLRSTRTYRTCAPKTKKGGRA